MNSKRIKSEIKKALDEGNQAKGKMTTIPRDTEIVGYTIKYSDGTEKLVDKGMIIYTNDGDISMEQNGDIGFAIKSYMSHSLYIRKSGLNVQQILNDSMKLIGE